MKSSQGVGCRRLIEKSKRKGMGIMSKKQIEDAVFEEAEMNGLHVLVPASDLVHEMKKLGLYWSLMDGSRLVPFLRGSEISTSEAWRLTTKLRGELFEDVALF